ncbi:MBOAT family O-acyltransferase [Treponema pedis]|uniref:MBOAT family O-acyltransferase n=1 Tax=Treponema pedis TaxID=409322 RepID=UPI002090852C|nr:MBOAT family O-acyltransferase [Treponema pedis]
MYFYACRNFAYILLILCSVAVTWLSGIFIERCNYYSIIPPPPKNIKIKKQLILSASLIINLAILFFFKYHNFFADTLIDIFSLFSLDIHVPKFNILLPVGISFYTFQAIGYSIDVYKGTVKAEKNFLTYALFVTFFPQLVAGPIERTKNLLPQFKTDHLFDYKRVTDGLKLAAWGMFKKIVIADTLSVYVTAAYSDINYASGIALAVATFFFAVQIFCDFSGYSDIAIGVAKVLGFNLMKNFDKPYFSASISEFWRRWHISLSTWFKDYLYIPLGGSKVHISRHYINLLITFFISGLWHGAALHFVAWGVIHAFYLIAALITKNIRTRVLIRCRLASLDGTPKRGWHIVQIFITFCLVCIAWIFFRADSIQDALTILKKIIFVPYELMSVITGILNGSISLGKGFFGPYTLALGKKEFIFNFILIILLYFIGLITNKKDGVDIIGNKTVIVRWTLYYVIFTSLIYVFVRSGETSEFIYFQF